MAKIKLDEIVATKTGAVVGFVWAILGWLWHGPLGQQTMMSMMQGFSWYNSGWMLYMLVIFVVSGAVTGYLIAWFYNYFQK